MFNPSGLDANTGLLWVGTEDDGVRVLDRSTGHFTSYAHDPNDPASLSIDPVSHIFQDRAGAIWLSAPGGLNRFDSRTHTFVRYLHDPQNPNSLSDNAVLETYEDRAGRFWVATNNGLNLMDRARGTFARYLHDRNDPSSVSSNILNYEALCEDASGAMWIGTRSTGVDRLVRRATEIHHLSPQFPGCQESGQQRRQRTCDRFRGRAVDRHGNRLGSLRWEDLQPLQIPTIPAA